MLPSRSILLAGHKAQGKDSLYIYYFCIRHLIGLSCPVAHTFSWDFPGALSGKWRSRRQQDTNGDFGNL
jgi:hypothetical protein